MKNFYKKIIPFFGASCCFFPNQHQDLFNGIEKSEKITIKANLKQKSQNKKVLGQKNNNELIKFLKELNKTEIYVLVTDAIQEKLDKHILLLLHTEDRLSSEQALINDRSLKFLFSTTTARYKKYKRFSVYDLVNWRRFPAYSKTFRSGKSYYVNNQGGYKSICPVFFDKSSADDFLIQTSRDALTLLKNIPPESNQEILKGILNTKIISLGLGDFIEYYSLDENKTNLEKVDFLFVPCLRKEKVNSKNLEKRIKNIVNTKSFKSYQQEYYNLKAIKK